MTVEYRPGSVLMARVNSHRHLWDGSVCKAAETWDCGAEQHFRDKYCSQGMPSCFHRTLFQPPKPCFQANPDTLGFLGNGVDKLKNQLVLFSAMSSREPGGVSSRVLRIIGGYFIERAHVEDQVSRRVAMFYPYSDRWFHLPYELGFNIPFDYPAGDYRYFCIGRWQDFEDAFLEAVRRANLLIDAQLTPLQKVQLQSFADKLKDMRKLAIEAQPVKPAKVAKIDKQIPVGDIQAGADFSVMLQPGIPEEPGMKQDPLLLKIRSKITRRKDREVSIHAARQDTVNICRKLDESSVDMRGKGISIAAVLSAVRYCLPGITPAGLRTPGYPQMMAQLLLDSEYCVCADGTDHRIAHRDYLPARFDKVSFRIAAEHSVDDYQQILYATNKIYQHLPTGTVCVQILDGLFKAIGQSQGAIAFTLLAGHMNKSYSVSTVQLRAVLQMLSDIGAESALNPLEDIGAQKVALMIPSAVGVRESFVDFCAGLVRRLRGRVDPKILLESLQWTDLKIPEVQLDSAPAEINVVSTAPQTEQERNNLCALPESAKHEVIRTSLGDSVLESIQIGSVASNMLVFSGRPGVGKSTLAMSLVTDPNRYLVVPVSASWRGPEDFLGYINPVTGFFEATPVTRFLLSASIAEQNGDSLFRVLILEELNLSQPEYWLSDLLVRMSATQCADRTLHFGGKGIIVSGNPITELVLPKNLKIVGTMNQDHTVQKLSPRVLDRSFLIDIETPFSTPFRQVNLQLPAEVQSWFLPLAELLRDFGFNFSLRAANTLRAGIDENLAPVGKLLQKVIVHQVLPSCRFTAHHYAMKSLADEVSVWMDRYEHVSPLVAAELKRLLNPL